MMRRDEAKPVGSQIEKSQNLVVLLLALIEIRL